MKAFKQVIIDIGNVLLFYVVICLVIWIANTLIVTSVGEVPASLLDILLIPVFIIKHARLI